MMKNFLRRPMNSLRKVFGFQSDQGQPFEKSSYATALVKSRPLALSESYIRSLDQPDLDALFLRLRRHLLRELQMRETGQAKALATREFGRLASGASYFYVQPFNQRGWLFERSDTGWVISRADKIHAADTFIRDDYAWDVATCLTNESYEATPRINSSRFDLKLVSLSLYEEKVIASILDSIL